MHEIQLSLLSWHSKQEESQALHYDTPSSKYPFCLQIDFKYFVILLLKILDMDMIDSLLINLSFL